MPERWVNAVIEIVVPLDGVTVDDPPERKLDAAVGLAEGLIPVGDSLALSVRWEDAADDTTGGEA